MPAVGQLRERPRTDVDAKDFTMHPHVDDGQNRAAVGRPRRAVELIREIGKQQDWRTAGSGDNEEVLIVVGLEAGVRGSEKEHLPVVGRQLRFQLDDSVGHQRPRVLAVGIYRPDLTLVFVVGKGAGHAGEDDVLAVAGQMVGRDREVARRDRLLAAAAPEGASRSGATGAAGPGWDGHFPEMPLLEVLVVAVEIVAHAGALALFAGSGIGGKKVDGAPLR